MMVSYTGQKKQNIAKSGNAMIIMEYEYYGFYTYVCLNPDLKEVLLESSCCATCQLIPVA